MLSFSAESLVFQWAIKNVQTNMDRTIVLHECEARSVTFKEVNRLTVNVVENRLLYKEELF